MSGGRPPGAKSDPAGYARPEIVVEDPALAAGRHHERRFIREKRALGVGWQNIARMLGKAESQLRHDHEAFL